MDETARGAEESEGALGLAGWVAAVGDLSAGLNASGVLALLAGLARSGQLESAVRGDVPVRTPGVAAAVHEALTAAGATGEGPGAWHTVLTGEGVVSAEAFLAAYAARNLLLGALAEGRDYWQAEPALRLAMAQGVSPDPRLPAARVAMESLAAALPEWSTRASSGARYLELGCGLAGGMLLQLQLFPAMTATGLELAPDLVAEAKARAEQVGVGARAELLVGDATQFDRTDSYDLCFWSQFFFPEATRAAALATAYRCLRPGGMVGTPVRPRPDADAASEEVLEHLLDSVLFASWGVPERSAEDLVGELVGAGFVDASVVSEPPWLMVHAFKP